MVKRVSLGRWVDGSYRLRVSAPGYNVDSTTLTPSQIVFDSTMTGTGFILMSGTVSTPGLSASPLVKVVSWASLGYVPAVHIAYPYSYQGIDYYCDFYGPVSYNVPCNLIVKADGIYLSGTWAAGTVFTYVVFSYGVKV